MGETDAPDTTPDGTSAAVADPTPRIALIDRHIQRYTAMNFSRDRMLNQLLAARWPIDQLRPRFPEFPESAFRHADNEIKPPPVLMPAPPVSFDGRADRASLHSPGTASQAREPDSPPGLSSVGTSCTNLGSSFKSLPFAPTSQSLSRALATATPGAEGISFQYVPLIQCSFPHADPKDATRFTRKNGWLELTLGTTRPDTGLPYGVPARLLTIYCTSEAVRTNSPEIYLGDSVHDFLRRLDVPITRGARGSLSVYANQLLRLIRSTLTIDENIKDGAGRSGLHIRQALFVEEAQLWWDEPESKIGAGSSLVLSSVLFHSILERSAPLATHAIKKLRKSPMDLDVYAWLVHRLFHLGKPSMVSWAQLSEQFGHNYELPRKFRHFFLGSLKRVLEVYPEAKLNVNAAGVLLLPSRPHLATSKSPIKHR